VYFHAPDVDVAMIGVERGICDALIVSGKPVRFAEIDAIKDIQGNFSCGVDMSIPQLGITKAGNIYLRSLPFTLSSIRRFVFAKSVTFPDTQR
jgi:hypothetical protein